MGEGVDQSFAAPPAKNRAHRKEIAPSDSDVALLWAACALPPDPDLVARHASRADLPLVLETAAEHRVGPLVLRALGKAGVSIEELDTWAVGQARVWEARAELALPAAIDAALAPLNEAGLRPLALKGLAIAARYPAPSLRPMDDIDLLLPPALARRAVVRLEEAGWRQVRHGGRGPDAGYDVVLVHSAAPGVPLELHHQLARWREVPRGLRAHSLWSKRVPIVVGDHDVWGLPPELELVNLIAHAAKPFHAFDRLLWIVDLAVSASTPGLDWDQVEKLLASSRRKGAGAVGLRLATRLGADIPSKLLRLPAALEVSGAVEGLLDPARPFFQKEHTLSLRYLLLDGILAKARLSSGELLRPPKYKTRRKVAGEILGVSARALTDLRPALFRRRH